MSVSITLLRDIYIGGSIQASGATVSVDDNLARVLVHERSAEYVDGTPTAWMQIPSMFRLRLTGTGVCRVDARDRLGNVAMDVAQYTVSGATNRIEYPYPGEAATEIRFRLTGDCQVEIL